MKKFLLYIFIMLAPMFAVAQETRSLEIDESSFAPIHTDALTGVAIDKIEPDFSRRPCARIKLHINRMSREDINGISVKVIGGNVVVMKRLVAAEGNGLIIELTAKPETRFYLHHDKFGDSNQVNLNLEGDKEYRLNAQLNSLQTVVISTNITEANVYIDDEFKGRTDESYSLTVHDILHGAHKLRVEYGGIKSEQDIVVSSTNIHFRLNIKHEQTRPQFVIFQISPKNASITIDGKSYAPDSYGYVQTVLNNGSYTYSVSTKDHHSESGTFVVNGAKVEKFVSLRPAYGWLQVPDTGVLRGASVYIDGVLIGTTPITSDKLSSGKHTVRIIKHLYKAFEGEVTICDNETNKYTPTLVADFANVSLSVGNDCDIYVNGERKGRSSWSGDLATGAYIFEARKEGHRTTTITKNIEAAPAQQSYNIPAPSPINGIVVITSSPAMAEVYIDDENVGRTPISIDLIIGQHKIAIKKDEHEDFHKEIVVEEGKTENITASLKQITQSYIYYRTSNSRIVNVWSKAFDANIVSNEYRNGQGVITFDKQITTIRDYAFYNCSNITSVTIPKSVTSVSRQAFSNCSNLQQINASSDVVATIRESIREAERLQAKREHEAARQKYINADLSGFGHLINFNYMLSNRNQYVGFNHIMGHRFNNCIFLGVGYGLNFHLWAGSTHASQALYYLRPNLVSVPLFVHFRAHFMNRRFAPFVALSAGGNISGKQKLELSEWTAKYGTSTGFINPQLGIDFRYNKWSSIYIAAGFQLHSAMYCLRYTNDTATLKRGAGYGYDIHMGFYF